MVGPTPPTTTESDALDARPVEPAARRGDRRELPDWAPLVGVPLMIFFGTRIAQLAVLALLEAPGSAIRDHLLSWDSGWFLRIAAEGYPHGLSLDPAGVVGASSLAFFPLYPMLVRAGTWTGLSAPDSALVVSWLAGAAAVVLLAALGRRVCAGRAASGREAPAGTTAARRTGYALAALVCLQPMSIVLSMGYSESLFVAVVAGALVAAHDRRWVLAGLCGVAAGLSRPTGAAVAVALAVAAGMCVADRSRPAREKAVAVGAAAVALAAVPAYIGWVGLRVGHADAWFRIESEGWGTTFDFGRSAATFLRDTLRTGDGFVAVSVALLLVAATVALVVAVVATVRRRVWAPLTVYGVLAFAAVVGQAGYYHSKPRLLVPVLLLLVPAALAAGRARPRTAVAWIAAFGVFGLWYGAYMVAVWPYAI